ncbi:ImmA/IrrE family metallo-endopeptidase [Anaerosolibacter sp.]|uniref:ImmA/IrrE family metallo-endopeptidase n=1 Tax=Anaerosolibacter sp. TaxID=1872527 RepID=UPI0039F10463
MTLICNLDHYTLNKIPQHRIEFIELKLKQFIKKNDIKKWPLDCVVLLKELRDSKRMPLILGSVPVTSSIFDAQARYYPDLNVYMFLINKSKVTYPFKSSKDRRLNFTLAHEIGHVVLGHLDIPDHLKTKKDRDIEEQEANEFAGRLLAPEQKLLSCNFTSIESVAAHFNISKQALWKRLNHLQKLDLIKSKPLVVCNTCGNSEVSVFADCCKICGSTIGKRMGVEIVKYRSHKLNPLGKASICPICKNEETHSEGEYCKICGTFLYNVCAPTEKVSDTNFYYTQKSCGAYLEGNARYCENCGNESTFYRDKLLSYWIDEKNIQDFVESQEESYSQVAATLEHSYDNYNFIKERWISFLDFLDNLKSQYVALFNHFELTNIEYDEKENCLSMGFMLKWQMFKNSGMPDSFHNAKYEMEHLFSRYANLEDIDFKYLGAKHKEFDDDAIPF